MHIADLPEALAERGIKLGYRLTIDAPTGAVDEELRELLKRHKPALVEALARCDAAGFDLSRFGELAYLDADGFNWASGKQEGGTLS